MTAAGEYVEVQGTAERSPFRRGDLNLLLDLAERGIQQLFAQQKAILGALPGNANATRE